MLRCGHSGDFLIKRIILWDMFLKIPDRLFSTLYVDIIYTNIIIDPFNLAISSERILWDVPVDLLIKINGCIYRF